MKRANDRDFDVVLWGATGFTGRLVAEYLARAPHARGLRWALAGRDRKKLEGVRSELGAIDGALAELPILVGDAGDAASLDAIAPRARVVCTTVGPYARYGSELVGACARAGTDYCDLTGEAQWIRRMIDAHHDRAKETGARIVHTCGFDSIPSDLGVLMLQEHMRERHGGRCSAVRYYCVELKGGPSGGTIASMMAVMDEVRGDPAVRRMLMNPYSLNPDPDDRGPDGRDQMGVRYAEDLGQWTGPFLMASINVRVVRRSNALLGFPWGRDFRYSEAMGFGRGPKGFARATAFTAGMGAAIGAVSVPALRRVLQKRLPAPGEGPSAEERERGFFVIRLIADGETKAGAKLRLQGEVRGTSDPGYGETSKMLGESALCLAKDDLPSKGGVLTPATAMGMRLVERLRAAGMTFRVDEEG
jgi:short subunit dehydrogenase-like uncharacterized protein